MKVELAAQLRCPNSGHTGLELYGLEVLRGSEVRRAVLSTELVPQDDIRTGLLFEPTEGRIFPIWDFVAILLSDSDAEPRTIRILEELQESVRAPWRSRIATQLTRLRNAQDTGIGEWNRDEMRYYDAAVSSAAGRDSVLATNMTIPNWRVFLPRQRVILEPLIRNLGDGPILEIGCGTCRTIRWMQRPRERDYSFVGLDVSFDRLTLAKRMLPEADFVQGSGLDLPFGDESFRGVLLFGSLHHLPNQRRCIEQSVRVLQEGGALGLHEPIPKPQLFASWRRLRRSLRTYEPSEHDREVDPSELSGWLSDAGLTVRSTVFVMSPVRTLYELLIDRFVPLLARSRALSVAVYQLDRLVLRALRRASPRLGPHAMALFAVKGHGHHADA